MHDYKRTKQYLLTNNYYNVINGYSKYFQLTNSDKYLQNAHFNEISNLYFFDSQIKSAFLDAILVAENHIKYIVAYKFAEKYCNEKYSFLNSNNYNQNNILFVGSVISNFSKIIRDNTKPNSNDNPIKHYKDKYGDVPIWVIIEYLDFGGLLYFVRNLEESLINDICQVLLSFLSQFIRIYNQFTPKMLISFMDNIRQVRNVCAHDSKLLDFKTKQNLVFYKDIHTPSGIKVTDKRTSVYDIYIILKCFLSEVEYKKLFNTILKRIKYLDNKLDSISINVILNSLGFPEDWHLSMVSQKQ
ncbi:Abi family protein [Aerococcus sp. 1KP-2016]|uniref:Abi family protein n=1 Tax=Aerococcus sp. 1KP-2016 TaxID=1981982 RepID=UPI001F1A7D75|nr:Abi family protein [Aerococcus sp. 1KP-2016]